MMKLVQKTDSLMVMKDALQFKSIAGGAIIALFGIVLLINPIFGPSLPFWVPLLLVIIGVGVAVLAKDIIVTVDKGQSKVVVDKQGLLGKESKEFSFDQSKELQLRESTHTHTTKGKTHTTYSVKLFLVLNDGKEVLLASHSRSGHGVWSFAQSQMTTAEEKLGREISEFTKIPFKSFRPASVADVISIAQGNVPPGMENLPLENVEKPPAP